MLRFILLLISGSLFLLELDAQCCSGNQNGMELVVNGDFSKGNVGFNSSYIYAQKAGLGRYGITADAHSVHPDFWSYCKGHTIGSDSFLWIDLSENSNVNIWTQKISNVIPNRYYLFNCWVNNLGKDGPGILQFIINGKFVGRPMNAPGTLCNWSKFCYLWYSGKNTSVILTIANRSSGGSGNDCGLDDISFMQFQPTIYYQKTIHICQGDSYQFPNGKKSQISITYFDTMKGVSGCDSIIGMPLIVHPDYDQKVSISLCDGESYQLPNGVVTNKSGFFYNELKSYFGCDSFITTTIIAHAKIQHSINTFNITCYGNNDGMIKLIPNNGTAPYYYELVGKSNNVTGVFDKLSAGNYSYLIKDMNGCSTKGEIVLTQPEEILISVYQSNYTVDLNSIVNLSASCNYAKVSWLWKPSIFLSCDTCSVLTASPDISSTYKLIARTFINGHICFEDTGVTIRIKPFLYVPNAFSPNGDKLNEGFRALGNYYESIESFQIEIYNSWGQKLFESIYADFAWDGNYLGKQSPAGVYIYKIKYKAKNNESIINLRGTLNLLR